MSANEGPKLNVDDLLFFPGKVLCTLTLTLTSPPALPPSSPPPSHTGTEWDQYRWTKVAASTNQTSYRASWSVQVWERTRQGEERGRKGEDFYHYSPQVLAFWGFKELSDWSFSGYSFTLVRERLYNIDDINLSFLSVFIQNFINKKVYHLRTDDGQAISHWIESFSRNPDQAAVRERKEERAITDAWEWEGKEMRWCKGKGKRGSHLVYIHI